MLPILLPQKYYTKCCLEDKTQVNATCDSSGPAHSSYYNVLQEKHLIQRSLFRYSI